MLCRRYSLMPTPPKPTVVPDHHHILAAGQSEVLYLMGSTRLDDFLNYARDNAVADTVVDRDDEKKSAMDLAEAWRDAALVYDALKLSEPYPAEAPAVFPLPPEIAAHCEKLLAKPHVRKEFDLVPVALGMVPIAYLISPQQRIDLQTVTLPKPPENLRQQQSISDQALAEMCFPLDAPPHRVDVLQEDAGSVTFIADNHDIRFFRAWIAQGEVAGYVGRGQVQQSLALPVGFSANVVNVIRFENRLVLNNGYHRVYGLIRRGVTHVPAIIQVCRHWEDVGLTGSSELYGNSEAYFESERPPLLRDFFDARLTKSFVVRSTRKFVRLRYQVETGYLRC